MNFTKFVLERPLVANLLTFFILGAGLLSLTQINRATYPDVNFDILQITGVYPGASAEEIEVSVTKKIEDELLGISGIDKIISTSTENYSTSIVWVDLNDKDPGKVKDNIRRKITNLPGLPSDMSGVPLVEDIEASNVPVIEIALSSKSGDELSLRKLSKNLEDSLREIKGVSEVKLIGYRDRQTQIKANPDKLSESFISLATIAQALELQNLNLPGGDLNSFGELKKVTTTGKVSHPEEISKLILRSNMTGQRVVLEDVATISNALEKPTILSKTEGNRSINIVVRTNSNGDITNISNDIEQLILDTKKNINGDIEIKVVRNFGKYIDSLLSIVSNNAYIGFVFVFVTLMIFLNRYAAFWTALGIPMSVLGAFIFFSHFGITINFIALITLILVLGLIVDDAIVVSENICRHRDMGKDILTAAIDGTKEVTWPVITTIITTILAFAPIFFMTGVTGRFIQDIPKIVILTLIISLIESLIILPSHIAHGA